MKLLVLGGTGRTGSLVTRAARVAGHEVTVLVREPSRIASRDGLRVLTGDATVATDVGHALAGQDALISALGSQSMLRSNIATPAAEIFVPIAEFEHVRRVVVMSAFGVGDTYKQSSPLVRAAFATVLRSFYNDKTAGDTIVNRSSLDWTIVHPVTLTDEAATGIVTATDRLTGGQASRVSRADVAQFLVACLTSAEWSRKTAILTSAEASA